MQDRVIELEIRYSHQHDQLEKLNQVVYEHERTIERLTARIVRIEQLLLELTEGLGQQPPHEKPPHY